MRAARGAFEKALVYLHAENHDFRTNGETRVLDCLGSKATIVLDVGANVGGWALEAHARCPNAVIYCFEIVSETRYRLRANLATTKSLIVQDFGLADHEGMERVKFYPTHSELSALYDFPHSERALWKDEPVKTGDTFVKEQGLSRIDLLKVDVEGAELLVIRGFEHTLKRRSIAMIQFEYGYASILSRNLLIDFYEYLTPLGFVIGKLHSKCVGFQDYKLQDENFFGPNFVAVHKSYPEFIAYLSGAAT